METQGKLDYVTLENCGLQVEALTLIVVACLAQKLHQNQQHQLALVHQQRTLAWRRPINTTNQ